MFVIYGVIALWAFWPIWPGDPHQVAGFGSDPSQAVWFLQWTASAILHGHNPWLTNYLEYPRGVNLAQNTSMPLLGMLGLPFTVMFGPISAFNLMMWLAFPASAIAAFAVLRRWVKSTLAAFVGGLLYGFSPYMVGQGLGHLNLIFVPFPPLVLLLVDELCVRQRKSPLRSGFLLGLVLSFEFLVSSEVFASTIVIAVVGVVVLMICWPRQVAVHARHALLGLVAATITVGLVIAYPLWVQLFGPGVFRGGAQGGLPFPADALGTVVPTKEQLLAPPKLAAIGSTFTYGNRVENGSYLGVPLLLASLGVVIGNWRMPLVRFAAAMAAIATVISLGPSLELKGVVHPGIPLPDKLLDHIGLFQNFVYSRFALYADLFIAVLLALGIERWERARRRPLGRSRRWRAPGVWWSRAATAVALAVVLLPIVPSWPYRAYPTSVPAFFHSSQVRRIPVGGVVLTYPYPSSDNADGMLWQAVSDMRFKLMGGYALTRAPNGAATYDPFPAALPEVPAALWSDFTGRPVGVISPGQVREFLRYYGVGTIVFVSVGSDPRKALSLLESALGPPAQTGGVDVWYSIQALLRA
ncbi:MAG: hypothetical protein ACRDVP_06235 [Acidimicrobiales bacterium]